MSQSQPPIKIIVVDDHPAIRCGLVNTLPLKGNIRVVAEASNGHDALSIIGQISADLLLLDFSLPEPSGITLIRHLKKTVPGLPILVLSMESNPEVLEEAMHNGASGYVLKGTRMDTLVKAISKVAGGETFIDPDLRDCS